MRDISVYEGADYDPTSESGGDGEGVEYTNWDKKSLTMCKCDLGFFGPDCSMGKTAFPCSHEQLI
jgi:hypothetical protein